MCVYVCVCVTPEEVYNSEFETFRPQPTDGFESRSTGKRVDPLGQLYHSRIKKGENKGKNVNLNVNTVRVETKLTTRTLSRVF